MMKWFCLFVLMCVLPVAALAQTPEAKQAKQPDAKANAQSNDLIDEHDSARRKAELEKELQQCEAQRNQARRDLEAFDAQFQKAQAEHPGRAAYIEAMAATETARENLMRLQGRVEEAKAELARAKAESHRLESELETRRRGELFRLEVRFADRIKKAEAAGEPASEIRRLRSEYDSQRNLTLMRFDNLRGSQRMERADVERRIQDRIMECEDQCSRLKRDELDPAMAKAAPYQAFLESWNAKRDVVASRFASAEQACLVTERRLDNLPKPRPAEDIAQGKLKMAKNLLERNPSAAKTRLEEIVDKYPKTQAAAEAKKLLEEE